MSSTKRIYRILDFSRVVELFETGNLYFAHPSTWPDKYETQIQHDFSHQMFAQCWSTKDVSDAMWRIYSPGLTGVRISTTVGKLEAAIKPEVQRRNYRIRFKNVRYLNRREYAAKARAMYENLIVIQTVESAAEILYHKRDAFEHENEIRLTIYCPDANVDEPKSGIELKVNPHDLINNIYIDPRAPTALVKAFQSYFTKELRYQGKVMQSALYKNPSPLMTGFLGRL